jgi:hypothetical protein
MGQSTEPKAKKHHHRRYTWPPSLHLIDVSNIRIPLPDIEEDPFAHFVSPVSRDDDDDDDHIVYTAGILPTDPISMQSEKAFKFRSSISRRWKAFFSKYRAKLHSRRENSTKADHNGYSYSQNATAALQSRSRKSSLSPSLQTDSTHSTDWTDSQPTSNAVWTNPPADRPQHPQRTARNKVKRYRMPPYERRSWHAPSVGIFTILEGSDEEDEPIEKSERRKPQSDVKG